MLHKIPPALILLLYMSAFLPATSTASDVSELVMVVQIEGTFNDVKDRVIFAVESQGLVVDHISDVGGMLSRTGEDLGEGKTVYGNAEVLEFQDDNLVKLKKELASTTDLVYKNLKSSIDEMISVSGGAKKRSCNR